MDTSFTKLILPRIRRIALFMLFGILALGTLDSCASNRPKPKYKKRKQKIGKPMPCPVKDC